MKNYLKIGLYSAAAVILLILLAVAAAAFFYGLPDAGIFTGW